MATLVDILQGHLTQAEFDAIPTFVLGDGQIVWLKDNSGTFKKGDGTTQLSTLTFLGGSQTLEQVVTNGGVVTGSDNVTPIFEIDKSNDLINIKTPTYFYNRPIILGEAVAKVLTLDTGNRIVSTGINHADIEVKTNKGAVLGNLTSTTIYAHAKGVVDYVASLGFITNAITALGFTPENVSNKQNSLTPDGTGVKYPTVDSINAGVWTKQVIQITSSTAPTVNTTGYRRTFVDITAQAGNINLSTNLTGTPQNGDVLIYQIKDNGTARTIATGSNIEAKGDSVPTTTVISKRVNIGFTWDSTTSKWGCLSVSQES